MMKIVKYILERPLLVLLLSLLLILLLNSRLSIFVICFLFAAALILALIQKKWLRFIFSLFGHLIFLAGGFLYFFANEMTKPHYEIGNKEFYEREILRNETGEILKERNLFKKETAKSNEGIKDLLLDEYF